MADCCHVVELVVMAESIIVGSEPDRQNIIAVNTLESEQHFGLTLDAIVETSIYCEDLEAMEDFYSQVLNLPVIDRDAGRHVFLTVGPASVLLIFRPETTLQGHHLPAHGAIGAGHIALGVKAECLPSWRARLIKNGIAIEKDQTWPRGGHSIYFRDPAGNSIELITRGVWGTTSGW